MTGKRLVWSVGIFPVTVMVLMKTWLERTWGLMVGPCLDRAAVSGINVGRKVFVDRIF